MLSVPEPELTFLELVTNFEMMMRPFKSSNIRLDGLLLNIDADFNITEFREYCYKNDIVDNIKRNKRNGKNVNSLLDNELYRKRFIIERTNAWLDGFKAILARFQTKSSNWKCLNINACSIILLRQL